VQLTSDGHKTYLNSVPEAFGEEIDYAMLRKIYGEDGGRGSERRYSPGVCLGAERIPMIGIQTRARFQPACGASEFDDANGDAEVHALDQRLLEESREPRCGNCTALHVVQLRTQASDAKTNASDAAGVADHIWSIGEVVSLADSN
jgi:hypothetical protein